jgi:hypothetical protein
MGYKSSSLYGRQQAMDVRISIGDEKHICADPRWACFWEPQWRDLQRNCRRDRPLRDDATVTLDVPPPPLDGTVPDWESDV